MKIIISALLLIASSSAFSSTTCQYELNGSTNQWELVCR